MEDNESEVMKVEMALDVLDGTRTSGTKGSELSVEKRHVDVKQRRKLFKNFARFVDTADEVEKKVMENLLSVQSCTERQREMIVAPIEEFRKELWERFEEIGRDKWPRAVRRVDVYCASTGQGSGLSDGGEVALGKSPTQNSFIIGLHVSAPRHSV
uniref:Uncharacterized protein n=1 Tax=Caenorhabditis japonica TaxID=281687 RepID=A0A8R1EFQ1_CAEJA